MSDERDTHKSSEPIDGKVDERKGRLLVEIQIDVISTNVATLRKGLHAIIDKAGTESWTTAYLDLRNSRMVDSMGLNWLFAECMRLRDSQKKLVLKISSPAINRLIEFSGLDKLVTLKFRRRKQTR